MWEQRLQSETLLNGNLRVSKELIEGGWKITRRVADELYAFRSSDLYSETVALILAKALLMCKGVYSLILDYIGQESGALLRPTVECFELLEYLRQDRTRVVLALEDRLPQAGQIAASIDSQFRPLRDYLNEFASHLTLSPISIRHLVNIEQGTLVFNPTVSESVLAKNLSMVFAIILLLGQVGMKIMDQLGILAEELHSEFVSWQASGMAHFQFGFERKGK